MGIRVNVDLGWGFKHFRYENDPRITDEFREMWHDGSADILPQMLSECERVAKIDGEPDNFSAILFRDWAKGIGWSKDKKKPETSLGVHDFVVTSGYASETDSGICSILFQPPEHEDWSRHDDIIDYYMVPSGKDGGMSDSVKMIVHPKSNLPLHIYPYCCHVNRNTGEHVRGTSLAINDRHFLIELWNKNKKTPFNKKGMDAMKTELGFTSMLELQRNIVTQPPYTIRLFCKLFNVFKNPLTVYRLKPMIYTHWD